MIDMGFLSAFRRLALRDPMPIREVARRNGLSRNTIRKYLREGAVEPKFKTPSRPSKLDPYADRLSAWLLAQTRKPRKERRTVTQMHADLVKLGYDGPYGHVVACARARLRNRLPERHHPFAQRSSAHAQTPRHLPHRDPAYHNRMHRIPLEIVSVVACPMSASSLHS